MLGRSGSEVKTMSMAIKLQVDRNDRIWIMRNKTKVNLKRVHMHVFAYMDGTLSKWRIFSFQHYERNLDLRYNGLCSVQKCEKIFSSFLCSKYTKYKQILSRCFILYIFQINQSCYASITLTLLQGM